MREYTFISGPYRSPTEWGVRQHIEQAIRAAAWARDMGMTPFVPHTHYRDQHGPMTVDDILSECIEWLEVCDSIIMMPSWRRSKGACGELLSAAAMELEVVFLERDSKSTWGYRSIKWKNDARRGEAMRDAIEHAHNMVGYT